MHLLGLGELEEAALELGRALFLDPDAAMAHYFLGRCHAAPGERELAAKYHTNRNTLRDAVRRLEQARLVTVRHGQGVTVADFRRTGTMELLPAFLEAASDPTEIFHILEDILPARLMVLEFAARLAVRRANKSDIERLRDITELLIPAFERGDQVVIAQGFQRWLDALIDAGHSIAIRWVGFSSPRALRCSSSWPLRRNWRGRVSTPGW